MDYAVEFMVKRGISATSKLGGLLLDIYESMLIRFDTHEEVNEHFDNLTNHIDRMLWHMLGDMFDEEGVN